MVFATTCSGIMHRNTTVPSSSRSRGSNAFAGIGLPSAPSFGGNGAVPGPALEIAVSPSGRSTKITLVPSRSIISFGASPSTM